MTPYELVLAHGKSGETVSQMVFELFSAEKRLTKSGNRVATAQLPELDHYLESYGKIVRTQVNQILQARKAHIAQLKTTAAGTLELQPGWLKKTFSPLAPAPT
mmetsp:Transcript_18452/g.28304  ORF Transcript_18452/g.28304 Transcript_18452/m.28304 type:complete len:103 (-) Transcript_18452:189-497(-)